jgi:hypothetical protein
LSVRPGEVLECNGCHVARANQTPGGPAPRVHGRKGTFNPIYTGAAAGPFPGAVTSISADTGDTMAMARARTTSSCPSDPLNPTGTEHCGRVATTPSANVVYDEIWKNGAVPTDSFAYNYQDLVGVTPPTSAGCFPVWTVTCRITIHYATAPASTRLGHLHPLWSLPRPTAGVDDNMDGVLEFPDTCTMCHTRVNPADNTTQLPAGTLELTDEDSNADPLQKEAYRQLIFTRDALQLVNGALVRVPLLNPDGTPRLDADGNPTFATLGAPMNAGNARGSRFFSVMNNATHAGMLSNAELRLISEWLDIGAQYYNDPFPPTPQN